MQLIASLCKCRRALNCVAILGAVLSNVNCFANEPDLTFRPPKHTRALGSIEIGLADQTIKLDGGDLVKGTKTVFAINVRNTNESKVKITNVKTSCGCMLAIPEEEEIAGSKATKLYLTVSASKEGTSTKSISLTTATGSESSTAQILVTARCINPFQLDRHKFPVIDGAIEGTFLVSSQFPNLKESTLEVLNPELKISDLKTVSTRPLVRSFRLETNAWHWDKSELKRHIPIAIKIGDAVIQQVIMTAENPAGCVFRPNKAFPSGFVDEQINFKFYLQGNDDLMANIRENSIAFSLAGDKEEHIHKPTSLRAMGKKLIVIEISIEKKCFQQRKEVEIVWKLADSTELAKNTLLLR